MGNAKPQRTNETRWDRYYTPPPATRILLDFLGLAEGARVYEPCAGGGDIVEVLQARDCQVRARDFCPETPYPSLDFMAEPNGQRHKHHNSTAQNCVWADWLITNPPYEAGGHKAEDFVERGIAYTDQSAWLLRGSFQEPTGTPDRWGRAHLFKEHPPAYQLILPRFDFIGPDGGEGNSEHSWWGIWIDGNYTDTITKWVTPEMWEMAKGQMLLSYE